MEQVKNNITVISLTCYFEHFFHLYFPVKDENVGERSRAEPPAQPGEQNYHPEIPPSDFNWNALIHFLLLTLVPENIHTTYRIASDVFHY